MSHIGRDPDAVDPLARAVPHERRAREQFATLDAYVPDVPPLRSAISRIAASVPSAFGLPGSVDVFGSLSLSLPPASRSPAPSFAIGLSPVARPLC